MLNYESFKGMSFEDFDKLQTAEIHNIVEDYLGKNKTDSNKEF